MIDTIDVALPGGRAAFTTRAGGVSEGPYESLNLGASTADAPLHVRENRRRVAAALELGRPATARQVHSARILEWTEPARAGEPLAEADGHITRTRGLGLMVLAADCLPVALGAPGQVAMLHCGWRGLAAGILERAAARFDEAPAAVIGPGIGPCCYEVGPEVLAAFEHLSGVSEGRMLDLKGAARGLLASAGVTAVQDVGLCTSCRGDLFFSHRRDRGTTGRQGGIAWRS
ncbi:MAG: peptidoglycan editing factor PgeF [Thermoleophilaceae bacterium]